jgi:hypothetical protein
MARFPSAARAFDLARPKRRHSWHCHSPFRSGRSSLANGLIVLLLLLHAIVARIVPSSIGKGTDIYLFLTSMMLVPEIARSEELFDRLAAPGDEIARASASSATALTSLILGDQRRILRRLQLLTGLRPSLFPIWSQRAPLN